MSTATFLARLLAILLIWIVIAGLCYLFASIGHFEGGGALLMVGLGVWLSVGAWKNIEIDDSVSD